MPNDQLEPALTAADVRNYDFNAVVARWKPEDWHHVSTVLRSEAEEHSRRGDSTGARVFGFLAAVASLSPEYDVSEGGNETRIGQIKQDGLDLLQAIVGEVEAADLQALIADILWIRDRRQHEMGALAVSAYIESAAGMTDEELWPPAVDRLRRAVSLGAKLGKNGPHFAKAIAAIEVTLAKHQADELGLRCERLMSILLAQRKGDVAHYSNIAESIALRLEQAANWFFARQYWQQKAEWDRRCNQVTAAEAADLRAAETYIKESEAIEGGSGSSSMLASSSLAKGVEALMRAKAPREQIESAQRALRECQRKIPDEMTTISLPDHIIEDLNSRKEQFSEQAREVVRGRPVQEALLRLALLVSIPSERSRLRARMAANAGEAVFTDLTPVSVITNAGLTAGVNPPLLGSTVSERERIIQNRVFQELLHTDWPIAIDFQIEPAAAQIREEHSVRLRDFAFLVLNNPFVPKGREGLYARGLYAGFLGDMVVSTHLLIPQIENSIRMVLQREDVITTKRVSEEVEEERDLNWLLAHEKIDRCFQPEMLFHFRALLIERFAGNLRNEFAHGLISEESFHSASAYYLWWLTLRMCALPLVNFGSTASDAED